MKLTGNELVAYLNREIVPDTLMETLDIRFVRADSQGLTAAMPVTSKVHQPLGLLHGGATAALAESVGSTASHVFIDLQTQEIRGIELSINHLKSVKDGMIYAEAKPLHIGKTTHLWEIIITGSDNRMIAHAKLTNIVLKKK